MPQSALPATLTPHTVIAKRYRIEELIGSGGYASVYRATDMTLGYERAIKEVTDTDPGVREQFQLEADLLIAAKHPNIPHGYYLIEDRGRMFLVMEYVHGKDLEELLNDSLTQRGRPLDEAQVLRWIIDICGALVEMHKLKVPIIHRDIKPANIKITPEGRPVLIDFGLAKLQRSGRPTRTAAQGVSPGFAPPEQYMAKGKTDRRTDIYGIGATLYACLTGKDAPEAPARLLAQTGASAHGGGVLQPLRRLNPRVSEATERVVMKALELSPNQRQQSAEELREELQRALHALSAMSGSTMVMGAICTRCGLQNRPDAARCLNCATPLATEDPYAPASGKRAAVPPPSPAPLPIASRGTGKSPVVSPVAPVAPLSPARPSALPAASDSRTSDKQPAVAGQRGAKPAAMGRTGKQPVPAVGQRTAQQPAVPYKEGTLAAAASLAGTSGNTALVPRAGTAAKLTAMPRTATAAAVAVRPEPKPASAPELPSGAWIRAGTTPVGRFAKGILAFSFIETLWGTVVLALGILAAVTNGQPFPLMQFGIGWAVVVLAVSVLGGQALSRPVYRGGKFSNVRRNLQGFGLIAYTVLVHAVAIWGATVFASAQGNATLAIVAFILFGVNVLVVGILSIANTLG